MPSGSAKSAILTMPGIVCDPLHRRAAERFDPVEIRLQIVDLDVDGDARGVGGRDAAANARLLRLDEPVLHRFVGVHRPIKRRGVEPLEGDAVGASDVEVNDGVGHDGDAQERPIAVCSLAPRPGAPTGGRRTPPQGLQRWHS